MDAAYTVKSSQEQAVASWVDYLNQIRIDRLISRLSAEQVNLQNAQKTIHDTLEIIDKEIVNKGMGLDIQNTTGREKGQTYCLDKPYRTSCFHLTTEFCESRLLRLHGHCRETVNPDVF